MRQLYSLRSLPLRETTEGHKHEAWETLCVRPGSQGDIVEGCPRKDIKLSVLHKAVCSACWLVVWDRIFAM